MSAATRSLLAVLGGAAIRKINTDVDQVLQRLYASQPRARELAKRAKAILVFPKIIEAGPLTWRQRRQWSPEVAGKTTGYYNIAAASFGLQVGAQSFRYAQFFMTDTALDYLQNSNGWAIGLGTQCGGYG